MIAHLQIICITSIWLSLEVSVSSSEQGNVGLVIRNRFFLQSCRVAYMDQLELMIHKGSIPILYLYSTCYNVWIQLILEFHIITCTVQICCSLYWSFILPFSFVV